MFRKKGFVIVLVSLVIVIAAIFIFNNIQNKTPQAPKISLSEKEWNFGKIKENERPNHIFTITNTGGEELVISRVRASCGCTATMLSSDHILPGKSAELKTTFNPRGYEGEVKKSIYIESNDPELSKEKLTIIAEIETLPAPKAFISNSQWDLGLISQGDSPKFSFTIENKGELDLIINKIDISEYVKYDMVNPLTIKPGEKQEVTFTYNSTQHKLGEVKESIRIYCNDPRRKAFSLRISGYIKEQTAPTVSISPAGSNFSLTSDSKEGLISNFILENLGEKAVRIISIKTSADYLIPLCSEFDLKSKEKQNLQVVLLKGKAQDEIEGEKAEEYLYLTIALPIEISK